LVSVSFTEGVGVCVGIAVGDGIGVGLSALAVCATPQAASSRISVPPARNWRQGTNLRDGMFMNILLILIKKIG
jgi:hypothetical protein